MSIGTIASADGLTAAELNLTAQPPFEGWPGDPSRVTEVEPGVFSIRPRGDEGEPRLLRFEETPTGLRVVDEADGTELATLDGFTPDLARRWVLSGPHDEDLAARVDRDRLVPTSTGGPVLGDADVPRLAMLGTPEGIVAMEQRDPAGVAVAWRLDAAGNWTELGPWDISVPDAGGTFYIGDANQDLHSDSATNESYALYDGPGTSTRRS
ncbi:MAG: hypothetical protein LH650_11255 [Chloroflexi bacterium]|nr:hypothetical protein [Chloroflexota bacterium]